MGLHGVPTTVVICCPVTQRGADAELDAMVRRAREAIVPVTWVASIDSLAATSGAIGGADRSGGIALALEPSWFSSRQMLRRMLGRARTAVPSLSTVVLRGAAPLDHRAVLVEEGIRTICVDSFDDVARVSRRPAPQGWPCRTVVWGLWEVKSVPQTARGMLRSLIPWRSAPRPALGSLALLHAGPGSTDGEAPRTLRRARPHGGRRPDAARGIGAEGGVSGGLDLQPHVGCDLAGPRPFQHRPAQVAEDQAAQQEPDVRTDAHPPKGESGGQIGHEQDPDQA